jgi:hypothetical protein
MHWNRRSTPSTPRPGGARSTAWRSRISTRAGSPARSASIPTFALDLGQTVRIRYPRYGLAGGRNLLVVGMVEDATVNEVTLDLWG